MLGIAGGCLLLICGIIIGFVSFRKKRKSNVKKAKALKEMFNKTGNDTNNTNKIDNVKFSNITTNSADYMTPGGPKAEANGINNDMTRTTEGGPASMVLPQTHGFGTLASSEGAKSANNMNNNDSKIVITAIATSPETDETKEIEFVTPGNERNGMNRNNNDAEEESSSSSEAELAEIRNAIVNNSTAITVNSNNNNNIDNNRNGIPKLREIGSNEMNVELANLMIEKEQINANKNGNLNGQNSNNKVNQFGVILNDGKMVNDLVIDDIVDEMNDEANGIDIGTVTNSNNNGAYVTPGGNGHDNDLLALGGEGEGEGNANDVNSNEYHITPM